MCGNQATSRSSIMPTQPRPDNTYSGQEKRVCEFKDSFIKRVGVEDPAPPRVWDGHEKCLNILGWGGNGCLVPDLPVANPTFNSKYDN